jgi:murein DD-endopeptidase MepM/ murein hydrolase activator NlpD
VVRNIPAVRSSWARLSVTGALTASLLLAAMANPTSSAATDNHHAGLHHRKHRLDRSIDSQKADVAEVSRRLLRTRSRLVDARGSLQDARAELAADRADVRAAVKVDQEMQARLDVAVDRLRDARSDLAQGQSDVRRKRAALAAYAVSSYQAGGSISLGIAFESGSAQEALDNLQAADTVLDKQSNALQRYLATRVLLRLTAIRVHENTVAVASQRAIAAANLRTKQALQAQARTATAAVAERVDSLRTVRSDMRAAKQTEIRRLSRMKKERDRVGAQLRAIAERRARRHAQRLAKSHAPPTAPASLPDNGYLDYPVRDAYVTSPYGMRMHPILHIWELHDGTDFSADCGTPVYAAAAGKVMEEYFNVGFGNRLILDNGYVRGVSLSTSYNHLSSYAVGVGERVSRGQLIAHSGNTGWSTACHLHFSVYVNGSTVDPMTWL